MRREDEYRCGHGHQCGQPRATIDPTLEITALPPLIPPYRVGHAASAEAEVHHESARDISSVSISTSAVALRLRSGSFRTHAEDLVCFPPQFPLDSGGGLLGKLSNMLSPRFADLHFESRGMPKRA